MRERAQTTVYVAVAALVPALAPLAPRATVPALVVGALGLTALFLAKRRRVPAFNAYVCIGFAMLIGWAGLSNLWSIASAWRGLAMLLGSLAAGLWLIAWVEEQKPELVGKALTAGMMIGLLVYAFEAISGAWATRFLHGFAWRDIIDHPAGGVSAQAYLINGTVVLSLLLWPAIGANLQRGRRWIAALLAVLVAMAMAYFGSDAGLLALAIGGTAWALSAWLGARAVRISAMLFVIVMLTTPFVAHRALAPLDLGRFMIDNPQVPHSASARLFIWKFAAERIAERPWLGWGFDAARRIPGGGESYEVTNVQGGVLAKDLYLPLHPHNQVLQIWLELGAVGAVIVAALGALLIWRIGSLAPPARNGAFAFAAAVLCYATLSFGAWQSWWMAAVFLGATMLAAMRQGSTSRI